MVSLAFLYENLKNCLDESRYYRLAKLSYLLKSQDNLRLTIYLKPSQDRRFRSFVEAYLPMIRRPYARLYLLEITIRRKQPNLYQVEIAGYPTIYVNQENLEMILLTFLLNSSAQDRSFLENTSLNQLYQELIDMITECFE